MDEDDNVPASWEDIKDSEFPPIKASVTMASASSCCSDDSADDWFSVKPGQLESSKWSMTFTKQAATPPFQCTKPFNRAFASFSDPAAPKSKHSGRNKQRSLSLYRPDADESGVSAAIDWSVEFKARYEGVITPFFDSHCHLDFLFKRSGFSGSFAKYRDCFANTFPTSFAGCIAVFCNPKTWAYKSAGKICIFISFMSYME